MRHLGLEDNAEGRISRQKPQIVDSGAPKASPALSPPMPADADLATIVAYWPRLATAIKAGILAMVRAAAGVDSGEPPAPTARKAGDGAKMRLASTGDDDKV